MRHARAALLPFVLAAMLPACAGEPAIERPFAGEVAAARRQLVEAAARGPVRLDLQGLPSSLTAAQAAALAAEGVSGISVAFATEAAAASPRLLLAFDPASPNNAGRLCLGVQPSVPATPHRLVAVFCNADRAVASVSGVAAGGDPADTERLVWRATARLFPDDYADTYGLNLFGSRLRIGVGGSFGF
jgi:hypothetical protein